MANVYFFTGFPGFITSALLRQLIEDRYPIEHIYLLVQEQMLEKSKKDIEQIISQFHLEETDITLISGDITVNDLGIPLELNEKLLESVTHVYHLAAIYDLAVQKEIAYRVNVEGTNQVNHWVKSLKKLQRYTYFSTAFISGKREGKIFETDLDMNQSFKNYYEKTKFEAEKLVDQIRHEVPLTIIRPGVVKGHSVTGETIKFDGPYFMFNFFDKLSFLPLIPFLGDGRAEGNFVPVDYVLKATLYLSHSDKGIKKTYHLTDPNPFLVNELYQMILEEMNGKTPKGKLPLGLAKIALSVPLLRKWLGVEKEAMDYFTCRASFDCSQAQQDLQGSSITCPSFKDVLPSMVKYYKQHKHDETKHVKIL